MDRRTWTSLLVGMSVLTLVTACGHAGKKVAVDDPTGSASVSPLSFDEAQQKAVGYADETLAPVFGPGAALEQLDGPNPLVTPCTDAADPPDDTPVQAESDYRVTGVDPGRITTYAAAFEKHFTDAGWKHLYGTVDVEGTAWGSDDRFVVMLTYAPTNQLISLTVQTPCVDPTGSSDLPVN